MYVCVYVLRLHAELRELVERQLQALPVGLEGDTLGEEGLVKNLQEQIHLSVQVKRVHNLTSVLASG